MQISFSVESALLHTIAFYNSSGVFIAQFSITNYDLYPSADLTKGSYELTLK